MQRPKFISIFNQLDSIITADTKYQKHPLTKLKEELEQYLRQLPVLGFNSGHYDLNLIKSELIELSLAAESENSIDNNQQTISNGDNESSEEDDEDDLEAEEPQRPQNQKADNTILHVIKKNEAYMQISYNKLIFLDIMSYISPGFSYEKYLKAYNVDASKGYFPYEFMDSLSKLDTTELPSIKEFYSSIKGTTITPEQYKLCQKLWHDKDMNSMRDFLIEYNLGDCKPFLTALDKHFSFYKKLGVDLFKDGISLPGITLKYLFKTLNTDTYFSLINKSNSDLLWKVKKWSLGGMSIVINRYQEKNVTTLPGGALCNSIVGYDASSMYLSCFLHEYPTKYYCRYKHDNNFTRIKPFHSGYKALEWLEWYSLTNNVHVRHKFNNTEFSVNKKPVDGYIHSQKLILEFHGCIFHGHCCKYAYKILPNAQVQTRNPLNGRLFSDLDKQTKNRTEELKQRGYKVLEMYECQWDNKKKNDSAIKQFIDQKLYSPINHPSGPFNQKQIIQKIMNNEMFGLVDCDISVPPHLRETFAQFPPIYKTCDVSRADIGEHMADFAKEQKILTQPRKMLILSYHAENILLSTPIFKWYVNHGLEIGKIHEVVTFTPEKCFEKFALDVVDSRRQGDVDKTKHILGQNAKLLGNSAYGKFLTNVLNHKDVKHCSTKQTAKLITNPRFKTLSIVKPNVYEITLRKKFAMFNLPTYIGFWTYSLSKMFMLEFIYDCLDKYVSRDDYCLIQSDTDSIYIALSRNNLDAVIKPELREHFFQNYGKWFPEESCDKHKDEFVVCKVSGGNWDNSNKACCVKRQQYCMRTPLKFKIEWSGSGCIALSSKLYYCFDETEDNNKKISCKGISKRHNQLNKNHFLKVLNTKQKQTCTNHGFMTKNHAIYTYSQYRCFSYFYGKRKIQSDGVSSTPLDL